MEPKSALRGGRRDRPFGRPPDGARPVAPRRQIRGATSVSVPLHRDEEDSSRLAKALMAGDSQERARRPSAVALFDRRGRRAVGPARLVDNDGVDVGEPLEALADKLPSVRGVLYPANR
jgi:hypothetical protein